MKPDFFQIKDISRFDNGERIIIDFAERLYENEGVFVGNASDLFVFLLSENLTSENYNKREFRVNAGALHQYILLADNKTKYLNEVLPGDRVQLYSLDGHIKTLKAARIKREIRPLIKVEIINGGKINTIYCQDASTVHFATEKGIQPLNKLSAGERVLCLAQDKARHQGEAIEEYLLEL